jgi:hypothetical protein
MNPLASNADANVRRKTTSPWRDVAGWIILAWVVVWSVVYFQSAVLHRFPGLLDWVRARP